MHQRSNCFEPSGWKLLLFSLVLFSLVLLVSVLVTARLHNSPYAFLGAFAGTAVAVLGFGAFMWWQAATAPPYDGSAALYYTGALYLDADGRLSDNPFPDGRPLGANGVRLYVDGRASFAFIEQVNGQWHATDIGTAFGPWHCFVRARG